ncbi:MAG: ATP-dependent Clp protease adaptor ClpS [Blastochloris sp.]|jgi:ATP-dependent Clp protease adaptor protein ClpS|nr:ATP-dependent Clp protease adaptor ClpS [Blastochloris sp.]
MTRNATTFPDQDVKVKQKEKFGLDKGWCVIVWNDHINTMTYVAHVFRKVLGFNKSKAKSHMMEVHVQGKSCVAKENREKAELYWEQLQAYGLRTTLEKGD